MDRDTRNGRAAGLPLNREEGAASRQSRWWEAPSVAFLRCELFHPASWAPGPFSQPPGASVSPLDNGTVVGLRSLVRDLGTIRPTHVRQQVLL